MKKIIVLGFLLAVTPAYADPVLCVILLGNEWEGQTVKDNKIYTSEECGRQKDSHRCRCFTARI